MQNQFATSREYRFLQVRCNQQATEVEVYHLGPARGPNEEIGGKCLTHKNWVCLKMSCTPLYPMVLLIIIPMKNG